MFAQLNLILLVLVNNSDDNQSLELQYEMEENSDDNNNTHDNNNTNTTAASSSLDPTQKLSYDKEEQSTQELNPDELAELEKDNKDNEVETQPKLLKELTSQLSDADMFAAVSNKYEN